LKTGEGRVIAMGVKVGAYKGKKGNDITLRGESTAKLPV